MHFLVYIQLDGPIKGRAYKRGGLRYRKNGHFENKSQENWYIGVKCPGRRLKDCVQKKYRKTKLQRQLCSSKYIARITFYFKN